MIRQWRIDRFNGIEFLVCEVYFKHTWTQGEVEAYHLYFDDVKARLDMEPTRECFRIDLDEWLEKEHGSNESFFGLVEPIPVIEYVPHLVVRGAIVNNRVASINVDYMDSVTSQVVIDSVVRFYDFVRSPHWRNSVSTQISNYGSLFGTENDS